MSDDPSLDRAEILSEALPYIQEFHGEKIVIKYGGSVMEDEELKKRVAEDIVLLQYVGIKPLVVHGGGPEIADTLDRLGIDSEFVDGLRVTDSETMDVVEMVLAGRVNKDVVNQINQAGASAIGLSGKDGEMLIAEPHESGEDLETDLGQVGQIKEVNPTPIELLEDGNYVPVIAPIAVDQSGTTYNLNADEVAGAIAQAIDARKLIYLTDVDGIMKNQDRVSSMSLPDIDRYLEEGIVKGGMIPKIESAREALLSGVAKSHIINGKTPHSLLLELLTEEGIGTQLIQDQSD